MQPASNSRGLIKRGRVTFFTGYSKRTKENGVRVKEKRYRINIRKDFPSVRGVRPGMDGPGRLQMPDP